MRVSLRQLRAFVHVADLGSFVAAAHALCVTPAALSVVVRALEAEVGFQLFERTTRQVNLSAAGTEYLQYARRVLAGVKEADDAAHHIRSGITGIVRVSATQGIACTVLPKLFMAFQAQHPSVRMVPIDTVIDEVTLAVTRGEAQFAIAPYFEEWLHDGALEAVPLMKARLHLVCRRSEPLARKRTVTWEEVEPLQIIYMGTDPGLRAITASVFGKAHSPAFAVDHLTTALGLVASGAGVAILTDYTAPLLRIHDLTMVPLVKPVVHRQVSLYKHRVHQLLPVAQAFERFLAEATLK